MARKAKQAKSAGGKGKDRRLVRIRAYARMAGVSAPTIVKAIREGKIKPADHDKTGPLIDPAEADRTWKNAPRKRRGLMQLVGIPRGPDGEDADELEGGLDGALAGAGADAKDAEPTTFFKARTHKEHYSALRTKLAYEEALGKLVDADVVKRDAFRLARKARDRILAIPDRLAAILAAEVDVDRVHIILSKELADVCREISSNVQLEEEPAS
jgi:hypothetical protein